MAVSKATARSHTLILLGFTLGLLAIGSWKANEVSIRGRDIAQPRDQLRDQPHDQPVRNKTISSDGAATDSNALSGMESEDSKISSPIFYFVVSHPSAAKLELAARQTWASTLPHVIWFNTVNPGTHQTFVL